MRFICFNRKEMKIFVIYKNNYKDSDYKTFSKAIDNLKRLGHNIKSDLELRSGLKKDDPKSVEKYQGKVEKAMRDTDIVIADISDPDTKVGFDIASALSEKKIVVALQEGTKKMSDILPIEGTRTKQLITKNYTDKNIVEVVNDAIEEAKDRLDTKFILIISPEIDRYLDWASNTKRMHKAQIVRNSIESAIKKDREYKNFLNG